MALGSRGNRGLRALLAKLGPEANLQIAVATYLSMLPGSDRDFFWTSIPNESRRSKVQGMILKMMGLRPGVADLLFVARARGGPAPVLWVELKSETGRLSPNQIAFRDICRNLELPYVVARSVDDVQAALLEYGFLERRNRQ